jgi:hypothetical protein
MRTTWSLSMDEREGEREREMHGGRDLLDRLRFVCVVST